MIGLVNREGLMATAAYGAALADVELYPDAGHGDRRGGQRDGGAERSAPGCTTGSAGSPGPG